MARTRTDGRTPTRPWAVGLLAAVVLAVLAAPLAVAATGAGAQGSAGTPLPAPPTRLADGGRTATDGQRVLSVSQAAGVDPAGQVITVSGSGYDEFKGVYVAFCLVPPTNQLPTPCGGGIDMQGVTGASQWISSNPKPYGEGLAVPYGPGGSFEVSLSVSPAINASIDCRRVRCAIVTRNDHDRGSDRSQDIFIPITFASEGGGPPVTEPEGPPVTEAPPETLPPPPVDVPLPPPATTLAPDGTSVTDGTRTLAAAQAAPDQPFTVTGTGYDPAKGVEVALCAVPAGGVAPAICGPATTVAAGAAPPAAAYGEGGTFTVAVAADPAIVAGTDCRRVQCALVTKADPAHPTDRSQELLLPVRFEAPTTTTTQATTPVTAQDGELAAASEPAGSSSFPWVWVVLAVVLALGAAAVVVVLVLRQRTPGAAS